MENTANEMINVLPATVQAVQSPMQMVAMVVCMVFIILLLLIVSNIMDKKNKAIVDKEAAVRGAERDARMTAEQVERERLGEKLDEHIKNDHEVFNRMEKDISDIKVTQAVIESHIGEFVHHKTRGCHVTN